MPSLLTSRSITAGPVEGTDVELVPVAAVTPAIGPLPPVVVWVRRARGGGRWRY
jgi:hypothetical protein